MFSRRKKSPREPLYCSLNHSSIQPTNQLKFKRLLLFNIWYTSFFYQATFIGAAKERERALNPPRGAENYDTLHAFFSCSLHLPLVLPFFFYFLLFLFVSVPLSCLFIVFVRAISRLATLLTQLTELSWLDMDVWWDIGNSDMLARRACIP